MFETERSSSIYFTSGWSEHPALLTCLLGMFLFIFDGHKNAKTFLLFLQTETHLRSVGNGQINTFLDKGVHSGQHIYRS